ncbi:AraC family transcriptional regulator [Virgisporangium aliadipatigenens]|uniref:AraC family transcriptional regulator n=1 Tax=Virgisporangium aliadipatigenens TaxID=741659 RepID=A0A8J3YTV6_9ACTN|nr:AraC family transcriptional regulator [Virgisporangium aliadipatigenens]GIJ50358.1 AraC family transcriptional regulator [Virgisporangium aliadipatigenens]
MQSHDTLSELLKPMRLSSVFYSRWTVRGPWNVQGDDDECAVMHYSLRNGCYVTIDGRPPVPVPEGTLAVFPYGTAHTLGDGTDCPATPLQELLPHRRAGTATSVRIGDEGPATELICASLRYGVAGEPPLYRALPSVIVLNQTLLSQEPLLLSTLQSLAPETERAGPGTQLVTLRAFEMVFVLALRVALESLSDDSSALQALHHPGISRALAAIYGEFQEPWTLNSLARTSGMSRSAFAKTFRKLIGEGPAQHLTRRRIREAERLLTDTSTPLNEIPELIGYQSTVGFHLAFRKSVGEPPGSYRQRRRAAVSS